MAARTNAQLLEHRELTLEQHIRHVAMQVLDFVYLALVNVPVREIREQLFVSGDVQLTGEEFRPLGAYSRHIFQFQGDRMLLKLSATRGVIKSATYDIVH